MSKIQPKSAADYGMSMTEAAARRIREIAAADPGAGMLRVAVMGGGCSGFQYTFTLDGQRNPDDLSLERDGAVVLVDDTSISLLQGSQIDFEEDLAMTTFVVRNPNATSSCGCGTSFAVA